jgi:hypothetical protein
VNGDSRVAILGLGVAFALPAAAGIWRAATLRSDTFDKLADRVDIAYSGLSELALQRLRDVQGKTDEHLGEVDSNFDPSLAVADPGELVGLTRQFEAAVTVRDKLGFRFDTLLYICKWAWVPALVYLIGVAATTGLQASDTNSHLWRAVAITVGSIGATMCTVVVVMYIYLHAKIASAEILGRVNRIDRS